MSNITCPNCQNQTDFKSKFCIFCGYNLSQKKVVQNKDVPITDFSAPSPNQPITEAKRTTFFCPICMHENSIDNYRCFNCKEDFQQYNIKNSISQSLAGKLVDAAKMKYVHPYRQLSRKLKIIVVVIFFALLGFFIWFVDLLIWWK